MSSKPHVVVFYGGTSGNQDLSSESGAWFCEYAPRSNYQITPIEVTPEGLWKVPLGSLPKTGSIKRMLGMLSQAVRPLSPAEGLKRLVSRPVDAFMTFIRGHGGDDGATHSLGQLLRTPVVGSPLAACQQTFNKYSCNHVISHITATPHARYIRSSTPEEQVLQDVSDEFMYPLFVKPASQEGSLGTEFVSSVQDLLPAMRRARSTGDVLIQEGRQGQEISVTLFEDKHGRLVTLPSTLVVPRKAQFYDELAKRRTGRVTLHTPHAPDNKIIAEAESIARDVFTELGCRGIATVDMMTGDNGIDVLEVNTVPMFTQFTPLIYQLKTAGLHPTSLFDTLLTTTLNEKP